MFRPQPLTPRIKDHYSLKGHPVTMGLRQLREAQEKSGGARKDSALVLALRPRMLNTGDP